MKRTWMKPVNPERRAEMHERNFGERPPVVWCVIAVKLQAYQARHGYKQRPAGWTRCWGPVHAAHVVHARGMGGCNSDKTELVYLCAGHHGEQEGRSSMFELRYSVNLRELAAEEAARDRLNEGPPC